MMMNSNRGVWCLTEVKARVRYYFFGVGRMLGGLGVGYWIRGRGVGLDWVKGYLVCLLI